MTESEFIPLQRANMELHTLIERLRSARNQVRQCERLASITQLAAYVSQEINNQIGDVFSDFDALGAQLRRLFDRLEAYEQAEPALAANSGLASDGRAGSTALRFMQPPLWIAALSKNKCFHQASHKPPAHDHRYTMPIFRRRKLHHG